jgi:hypothetical protein
MGCAGFGRLMGHAVGLASSFLGCHHGGAVSVLTDRQPETVRVLLRIVAGWSSRFW